MNSKNGVPTVAAIPVEGGHIDMTPYPTVKDATAYPVPNSYGNEYSAPAGTQATNFYPSPQPYVASIPPPSPQYEVPIWEQPKEGSKCCGCCCDFRRAVIIVDCAIISFSTYTALAAFHRPASIGQLDQTVITDDQVLNELGNIEDQAYLCSTIMAAISVVAMIVPIYGAFKFNNRLVGFGTVFLISSFLTQVVVAYMLVQKFNGVSDNYVFSQPRALYVVYAIGAALVLYPHFGLMTEIHRGIMSQETYPREEYSCCCMSRPTLGFQSSSPAAQAAYPEQSPVQAQRVYPNEPGVQGQPA